MKKIKVTALLLTMVLLLSSLSFSSSAMSYWKAKSLASESKAPVVVVKSTGYTSMKIVWTKVEGCSGYYIAYSKDNKNFTILKTVSSSQQVYAVKGSSTGKYYYFKVTPFFKGVLDSKENIVLGKSKTAKGRSLPSAPKNVNVEKLSGTKMKISYDSVPGATGYLIYYSKNNSDFEPYGKTKKTSANITIKENASYYFKVCAYRKESYGTYKGSFSYTDAVKFSVYDVDAAVNYAKKTAYDGIGWCAEYTARAVAKGGINIPNKANYYSPSTKSLTNRTLDDYTNPYTCSEAQLRWFKDQGYTVIKNPSYSQISLGDLVWNTGDGDNHVVIITGFNKNGTPLYSAHHNPALNVPLGSAKFVVKLS